MQRFGEIHEGSGQGVGRERGERREQGQTTPVRGGEGHEQTMRVVHGVRINQRVGRASRTRDRCGDRTSIGLP